MEPKRKLNPGIAALIVIVLVGVITVAVVAVRNQTDESNTAETSQTEETTAPANGSASTNNEDGTYTNGTYSETGSYISPGGRESVEVTLTIENEIITSAEVTANAASRDSKEYQDKFISGYKSQVVGKNVDEVSLSRVAGSSLTSNGFNAALELIKADATA